jgi:hypothetical protein
LLFSRAWIINVVEFAGLVPGPDVATMSPAGFFATTPFRHISVSRDVREVTDTLSKSREEW